MVEFQKTHGRLNAAQKRAVDAIEGPVLVVAGPGTGKTQLLTTRIANILDKTDALPSNILCLTFTDSAVTTMRERLTSVVGKAAHDITISTYHAFGSELIRRYPEYFMATADLRPVDDLTIDATLRAIFTRLPYSNPLRHDIFLRDIKTLISDSKRALLTPEDLRIVASSNEHWIREASKDTKTMLKDFTRLDKTSAHAFEKLLERSKHIGHTNPLDRVVSLGRTWIETLEAAVLAFHSTGKTVSLRQWKDSWLIKDASGDFVAAGQDQVRKLQAAAAIYERYMEALARDGLYDYDDMILHAIQGLSTHPDLRYTLQERFQYILLDEFQDTNEAQLRLVELLTDSPVHEGRPNVLAVGDDDQAIYAFQGANYSHMVTFAKRYRDVLVIPLIENYRSSADILQLAGGIASQIEARLQDYLPHIDKTITPAGKTGAAKTTVERHEFKTDLSQNAWIAKHIKHLAKAGIPLREIAVLAPKHEYLEALVPFLHQADLPVYYERRENVLEDSVLRELVIMSRLVLALADKQMAAANHLWPEVLSFDFWQLPTELIWQLSWQAADSHTGWTDFLQTQKETRDIALFFMSLSQMVNSTSMEQLLDILMGITPIKQKGTLAGTYRAPFYEHYVQPLLKASKETPLLWQLLSNLAVVRQHLREYKASEQSALNLRDFVEFIEKHEAAGIKIINTSPYQEATDAVELMTVYKAKGQEYSAVFVIASLDEVWGSKARNVGSRLSLPENLRYIRYAGTTEDERLRLLYVALTRAKSQLLLTSYTNTLTGKPTTRLKYLDEQLQDDGTIISPLLPPGKQLVQQEDNTPPALNDLTVYWQQRHYQAVTQPALKELLAQRLQRFQLSPTQLNQFTNVISGGPAAFFAKYLLRFPSAVTPSDQFGIAIHQTLEWIHLYQKDRGRLPTTNQINRQFADYLSHKRIDTVQYKLLLERGSIALAAYMKQRRQTINASNVSEFSFHNENIIIGPAHLSGKIDKLIINRKDKTITIVDYKTGKSYQRWARDAKLLSFRQQLYFYKLLVEQSRSYRGYKVTDAYAEFIEPDEQGDIHELHLQFDPVQEASLKQLVGVVWNHVQELKFPDTTTYSSDVKGIESFQHDLIAGTI